MQRVTNCLYIKENEALMLQKPRRGWWVAPGGKMESGESVAESVIREFREETNLLVHHPELKSVITTVIKKGEEILDEWMLFNFLAQEAEGIPNEVIDEGVLSWIPVDDLPALPMAEGDHTILGHAISGKGVLTGTFVYTEDYRLLESRVSVH